MHRIAARKEAIGTEGGGFFADAPLARDLGYTSARRRDR
jgi:hypothetical protein